MTVSTGTLNVNQVYNLLLNNGANNQEAATLAGISVWEAGGGNPNSINPNAVNPVAPDYSVGLFQYNFRYPPGFNAGNPLSSTRGGYSAGELLDSLNAQAQSALALLRGSGHNYATQWSTYIPHLQSIQGYVNQLIGGGTTDQPPADIGVQPTTGLQPTDNLTATANPTASGTSPGNPTAMKLNFSDTIGHSFTQLLLILFALVLLGGGIYLIGGRR